MKVFKVAFPENSMLSHMNYDYADSYCGKVNTLGDIDQKNLGKAFFLSAPRWIGLLLTIRNKIVSVFGLKTGNSLRKEDLLKNDFSFEKGNAIGLFRVYDKNDKEIIMGENDRHLDFRVSLLLEPEPSNKLTISTIVLFNNWLGRLYFLPVKPFHKLIVRNMLKRTLKELQNQR